jgi:hypothetical protein
MSSLHPAYPPESRLRQELAEALAGLTRRALSQLLALVLSRRNQEDGRRATAHRKINKAILRGEINNVPLTQLLEVE